jgi:hypothetical protein
LPKPTPAEAPSPVSIKEYELREGKFQSAKLVTSARAGDGSSGAHPNIAVHNARLDTWVSIFFLVLEKSCAGMFIAIPAYKKVTLRYNFAKVT